MAREASEMLTGPSRRTDQQRRTGWYVLPGCSWRARAGSSFTAGRARRFDAKQAQTRLRIAQESYGEPLFDNGRDVGATRHQSASKTTPGCNSGADRRSQRFWRPRQATCCSTASQGRHGPHFGIGANGSESKPFSDAPKKMPALCVFWRNQPFAFDFSVTMYLKAGVKVMGEHESR
jgi:hypothetical protein